MNESDVTDKKARRFVLASTWLASYVLLVFMPMLLRGEIVPASYYLLVAVGVIPAIFIEYLYLLMSEIPRSKSGKSKNTVSNNFSIAIFYIGFLFSFISLSAGVGTYEVQVGRGQLSWFSQLATPFQSWLFVGIALMISNVLQGALSKKYFKLHLFVGAILFTIEVSISGITVNLARYVLLVLLVLWIFRFITARALLISLMLTISVWFTLFGLRNSLRHEIGGTNSYGQQLNPISRLDESNNLGLFAYVLPNQKISQPGIAQALRIGLIPRIIDPYPRPPLATGRLISFRLGKGVLNSSTLTFFGNIFLLSNGYIAISIVTSAICLVLSVGLSRGSHFGYLVLVAGLANFSWIESMYPDAISGFIQTLVSSIPIFFILWLKRATSKIQT